MKRLVLASASPRRRELLSAAGIQFDVLPSHVPEPTPIGFASPASYASHVAWLKAHSIDADPNSWVLAADTIVATADFDRSRSRMRRSRPQGASRSKLRSANEKASISPAHFKILGKPADRADARRILTTLAGTRHQVLTGLCLLLPRLGLALVRVETSIVEMKPLTDEQLDGYLDTRLWEGKAGAYGIQDQHDPFVVAIEGSFSNIVGLPMEQITLLLSQAELLDP